MPIHIQKNNSWVKTKNLSIFSQGKWRHVKGIYQYENSQWQRIFSYSFVITVDTPRLGLNVKAEIKKLGWQGESAFITVVVNASLGAKDTASFALDTTGLPQTSALAIINNSFIVGAGGNGGNTLACKHDPYNTNSMRGEDGQDGGNAIRLTVPTSIFNQNGIIAGGGGGGAGSRTFTSMVSSDGNGGGGGAGFPPGAGGLPYKAESKWGEKGQDGSLEKGGQPGTLDVFLSLLHKKDNGICDLFGCGAKGGDLGKVGHSANHYRDSMSIPGDFAVGGSPGAAIIGSNYITKFLGDSNFRLRGKVL